MGWATFWRFLSRSQPPVKFTASSGRLYRELCDRACAKARPLELACLRPSCGLCASRGACKSTCAVEVKGPNYYLSIHVNLYQSTFGLFTSRGRLVTLALRVFMQWNTGSTFFQQDCQLLNQDVDGSIRLSLFSHSMS